MEANRRQYQNYNRTSYIEGNTVRKLSTAPDIRRKVQPEVMPPVTKERPKVKALSGINLTSLFVLSLAMVATLYFCVDYLKVQYANSKMQKQAVVLENTLYSMKNENDAALANIDTDYDLDYVYDVAVNELGMVYPNKNKVIKFKTSSDDYVRQYDDIPEVEKDTFVDKFMNK